MSRPLFTNNAATALAVAITPTDTILQVTAGTGEQFPSPSIGDYFMLTLVQINNPEVSEIVECIERVGDVFTVIRGQEGTSPQIFNISDNVQLRITAGSLNLFSSESHAAEDLAAYEAALSSSTGSSLIGYNEQGTAAVNRTVQAKLQETISVLDFGADPTGNTDSTTAFQNAINYANSIGGATLSIKGKFLINSNLILKENVSLEGILGYPGLSDTNADYQNRDSVLMINSLATITCLSSTKISKLYILRSDLVLPFPTYSAAQAGLAAYAGTAITIAADDVQLDNCMILGFNYAVYAGLQIANPSIGCSQCFLSKLYIDCNNGVFFTTSYDINRFDQCHLWPYTTVQFGIVPTDLRTRPGTGFQFTGAADWTRVTDCFTFGYSIGFRVTSCNSLILDKCSTDGPYIAGTNGIIIDGDSNQVQIINGQFAQRDVGITINLANSGSGQQAIISNCLLWGQSTYGIAIDKGFTNIKNTFILNATNGIVIDDAVSEINIIGTTYAGVPTSINNAASNPNVSIVGQPSLTFPSTVTAPYNSKTLYDYQTGTWTPSVGGTASYLVQSGSYTKIGNLVYIQGRININVLGTGSGNTISGLPFVSKNIVEQGNVIISIEGGLAISVVSLVGSINSNSSTFTLYSLTGAGSGSLPNNVIGNGTNLYFSGSYLATI